MKLFKVERKKGYTGPIAEAPDKALVREFTGDPTEELKQAYDEWATAFFERRPRGVLHPSFSGNSLVVHGTGGNGRWLVCWTCE